MLRDDRQVAINQVIEALLNAAEVHQEGADLLAAEPDLAAVLLTLAERRRDVAGELGDHVRRLGDLPSEPDADLQAAKSVLGWLQAALAEDRRDEVLQHCRQAEEDLAAKARAALEQDLPPDTRAVLEQLVSVPELDEPSGTG
jgi:uncharacterized protein (TIGR02284 family)